MTFQGPAIPPLCTPWLGISRHIDSDGEREALDGYPCPLCGAQPGEACSADSEFEVPVTHVARISLVRQQPAVTPAWLSEGDA
jgi:hypothetical protein